MRSRHRRHPHHDPRREGLANFIYSTAGTATLPTGGGTRRSCLADGPSAPTSCSSSPPRMRGDCPPLTATSPPRIGAHGLSMTTRACPARRGRADAHRPSVWGRLFASLPPFKSAGSQTGQTQHLARPGSIFAVCRAPTLQLACRPGRHARASKYSPGCFFSLCNQ